MSPTVLEALFVWRGREDAEYTSRQVGTILLNNGVLSVDRCRAKALATHARHPNISATDLINLGASQVAAASLYHLRKKGLVEHDGGAKARYKLTDAGRAELRLSTPDGSEPTP